jgi:N,N-dimethylformamidase beta subunit-like, C-terminal/Domain of unknown function (DUF4082)/Bacterial Ig-like domain/Bacterial Ig domain
MTVGGLDMHSRFCAEFRARLACPVRSAARLLPRQARPPVPPLLATTLAAVLTAVLLAAVPTGRAEGQAVPCGSGGNPVACENTLPGTPPSTWDIGPGEGTTIQGFADPFSVNIGQSINFKIKSPATSYAVDIYRMGYYGGDGARLIASVTPNITVSRGQPACNTNTATGLVDCGDWGVSATWNVPATAVSGVYFAHIYRTDGVSDENQVPFVVTDNASHSDIVFMTSDETWQAYNDWGGYSLYAGDATDTQDSPLDPGRAEQVSYNRPFATRFDTPGGQDYFFYAEFPMIEFLEKNGYDVSYVSQSDVAAPAGASLLEQHKVFVNVGHSEYWDSGDRANVTAARDTGVNIAFFAGNLMWWKTRWAASQYGNEADRTLITYKESLDSAQTDPADPPTWTGEWRDPRFSPPGDGGQPENTLTGQLWMVNCCSYADQVPYTDARLRIWRNTSVASLQPGQTYTMPGETLGYEWDSDIDNGLRPPGEIDMSKTCENVSQLLLDYREDIGSGQACNSLTLYRAASGALVLDAGTVQWAWGLESDHDGDSSNPPSPAMQQATVNLFADMGAQPATLEADLIAAAPSPDTTAPTSTITSPSPGATFTSGATVTITGTAADSGGGVVAGVEVSADGGSTWHPVTSMSTADSSVTWSYTWAAAGQGSVTLLSRATDDSANTESPGPGVPVTVNCPCGLFGAGYTPAVTSAADSTPLELGMKFQSSVTGWVAGVRFYKGAGNGGTHTGTLWTAAGAELATGTFVNETAGGWQTVRFTNPVQISANTTYIVSYYAPDGHYAADENLFDSALSTPPLTAQKAAFAGSGGGNGVFNAGGPGFPSSTYNASSYAVDVIFDTTQPPGPPPAIASAAPYPGSSSVPVSTDPAVTFAAPVVPGSASFTLTDASGHAVQGTAAFDGTDTVYTFTPAAALAAGTAYTVAVSGAMDKFGQVMTPYTYSFTTSKQFQPGQCPCTIWPDVAPSGATDAADASAVELGVTFQAATNGTISGIRFYKERDNTGIHTGTLWNSAGGELATGTFTNESSEGWEELDFSTPVAVTAGATYVASYHTSTGHYAATQDGLASPVTAGALTAVANGGVYAYGSSSAFPTSSYHGSNYWIDVVYTPTPDTVPPTVTSTSPLDGQTSVPTNAGVSFTFDKAVQASTIQFALTGPGGTSVPGSVSYDSATDTAMFLPTGALLGQSGPLSPDTTYTATVSGAENASGTPMGSPYTWSFTTAQATPPAGQCPCSIWPDDTQPSVASANDQSEVNLGVRFTPSENGWITGVRFYKGAANTGTHVGDLWDANGDLLGQVTFSGESPAGWQQADFSSPIPVTAGTTYIASYFAPHGGYAFDSGMFADTGVDNPPLDAPQSTSAAGNGVYLYNGSPGFPANSYNASNYWVDVVFNTTAP